MDILHGKWAVHESILPIAAGLAKEIFEGRVPDFAPLRRATSNEVGKEATGITGYINPDGSMRYPWSEFEGMKNGAFAVLNISGVMMKADNCDDGMDTMAAYVDKAKANANVTGLLMIVDSGGGQVMGTEGLASAIAGFDKPVVAWVNGRAASAAYWVTSQADHIVINGKTSEVGSIGVMATAYDLIPMWEKMGIKVHTVLADGSEDKNKSYFEMLNGNYDLVKAELNQVRVLFHETVKTGRAGKLKGEEMLTGKMYPAEEALKLGMVDQIGNMATAVAELKKRTKAGSVGAGSNSYTSAMGGFSLFKDSGPAVDSLFAKVAKAKEGELDAAKLTKLNNLLEASGSHVRVVGSADFDAVADAGTSLAAAEERAEKAEKKVKELDAEVKRLGDLAPAATGSASGKKEEGGTMLKREDYAYLTDDEWEAKLKEGK